MSKRKQPPPVKPIDLLWETTVIEYNEVAYRGTVTGLAPTNSEQGVLVSFRDKDGARRVVWRPIVGGKVVPV